MTSDFTNEIIFQALTDQTTFQIFNISLQESQEFFFNSISDLFQMRLKKSKVSFPKHVEFIK